MQSLPFQCVDKFNFEHLSLKLHFRLIENVCQSRRARPAKTRIEQEVHERTSRASNEECERLSTV